MGNTTTLNETLRSPVDGTEFVRLATPGANWKVPVSALSTSVGTTPIIGGTDTRVLFDKAGIIGEDVGFTFNYTNKALTLASIANPSSSTLILTGGTALTTNQPVLNMTQGWAAGLAAPTAIRLNVTDGGATGIPLLLDLRKGGVSQFNVDNAGNVVQPFGGFLTQDASNGAVSFGYWRNGITLAGSNPTTSGNVSWVPSTATSATPDVRLWRDGAGILAQQNLGAAQVLRVYNAFTDLSNYERGVFDWQTVPNVLRIGTEFAGAGFFARNVEFIVGNAILLDYGVNAGGFWTFHAPWTFSGGIAFQLSIGSAGNYLAFDNNQEVMCDSSIHSPGGFFNASGGQFGFSSTSDAIAAVDTILVRDGAGILAQRNSTNAQTFRVYNTFTDASNYERATLGWASNVLTIGTEKLGIGSSRDVAFTVGGTEYARMSVLAAGTTAFGTSSSGTIAFTGGKVPIIQALDLDARLGACLGLASFNTANDQPYAEMAFSRGTSIGAQTIVQSGDWLGLFAFSGSDGSGFKYGAYFQVEVDGAPGAGSMPGKFTIWTTPSGTTNPVRRLAVDNKGSVIASNAAVATNATDGFFYVGAGAGTPTGVPTTHTGTVPMYVDTTNSQLWLYLGGAWKQPKTPAGASLVTWQ